MAVKRKDFQKAAAFLHEFLLKLNEDSECAELRDTLNLALLQLQKYYRLLQNRIHEKNAQVTSTSLSLTARGLSPMTPFVDAPDKFQWRWINLDSLRSLTGISNEESINLTRLPAIIQAVKESNFDMCVELIQNDISCIEEQDGIGRTALIYAVHFHELEILKCLLESGAEVNATAHDGSTALHQACHDANHKALSMLLQYGGDFTMQDTQGRAPIHWAVTTKSTECLKYLIGHHADVNTRDKDGLSPCMWACRLDHIKHFELLSSSSNFRVDDADGIERDNNGRTWMHWSIRRSEPLECLQTLLTQETAAIKDEDGKTVLLLAAEMGSLLACKIIVEIGGTDCIYDRDTQERTALHLASVGGHGDIVNYLLDHGADLSAVDKFNANAWDYAKNRQLHYVQLIIMSHQRQRLQSNPTSPIPNGLGLSLMSTNGFMGTLGSMNGDHNGNEYEHMINTRGSFESMPITPPHPPKRPRTERRSIRTPLRRSTSLVSAPEREPSFVQPPDDRYTSSAGGDLNRRKERLDVSVNTRNTPDILPVHNNNRDDVPMVTDDNHVEDEIDDVSAGGMDVSDIEDEDEEAPPQTSRLPHRQDSGSREQIQPRPPPRQAQHQQQHPSKPLYAQPLEPQYNRRTNQQFPQDGNISRDYRDPQENRDYREAQRQQQQPPSPPKYPLTSNTRVISPHFNQSMNPSESFPPSRPRPAPRQPQPLRNTPPRPPPPRPTPSPARPSSGARDQLQSPPSTEQMRPTPPPAQDPNRPNSGSRPPGVVEGRRIPPPMLTPLENAPVPPSISKIEKKERKKKRKKREREREKEKEREADLKSPPMDLEPPRGYAAPLHPPPSATVRQQRAQSGIPAPRFSKQPPQRHESRYVDENMEDEQSKEEESSSKDPPVVNGYAVPMREGPARSARPGQSRLQPMESEEYEDDPDHEDEPSDNRDHSDHRDQIDHGDSHDYRDHREQRDDYRDQGDQSDRQEVIDEEEDVGPLIPPPQGFRGGNSRPNRPLVSQSIPQDSRSSRMIPTSAKPPLPMSGRSRDSSTSGRRHKSPSPSRRSRPHTGRSNSSS